MLTGNYINPIYRGCKKTDKAHSAVDADQQNNSKVITRNSKVNKGGIPMTDTEQKTLCAHVEEELHVKDPQAYINLIKPASHFCQGCGRSAASAENLCKPQEM